MRIESHNSDFDIQRFVAEKKLTAISGEQQKNNGNYMENNIEKWRNRKSMATVHRILSAFCNANYMEKWRILEK